MLPRDLLWLLSAFEPLALVRLLRASRELWELYKHDAALWRPALELAVRSPAARALIKVPEVVRRNPQLFQIVPEPLSVFRHPFAISETALVMATPDMMHWLNPVNFVRFQYSDAFADVQALEFFGDALWVLEPARVTRFISNTLSEYVETPSDIMKHLAVMTSDRCMVASETSVAFLTLVSAQKIGYTHSASVIAIAASPLYCAALFADNILTLWTPAGAVVQHLRVHAPNACIEFINDAALCINKHELWELDHGNGYHLYRTQFKGADWANGQLYVDKQTFWIDEPDQVMVRGAHVYFTICKKLYRLRR